MAQQQKHTRARHLDPQLALDIQRNELEMKSRLVQMRVMPPLPPSSLEVWDFIARAMSNPQVMLMLKHMASWSDDGGDAA